MYLGGFGTCQNSDLDCKTKARIANWLPIVYLCNLGLLSTKTGDSDCKHWLSLSHFVIFSVWLSFLCFVIVSLALWLSLSLLLPLIYFLVAWVLFVLYLLDLFELIICYLPPPPLFFASLSLCLLRSSPFFARQKKKDFPFFPVGRPRPEPSPKPRPWRSPFLYEKE